MSSFSETRTVDIVYPHPVDNARLIFYVVDPVHLLKCIRKHWSNQKNPGTCIFYPEIFSTSSLVRVNGASLKAIRDLHASEEHSVTKFGNGLSYKALQPSNIERQNVKLVLKVFSSFVVKALNMRGDELNLNYAEGTAHFIDLILKWWHVVNVKSLSNGRSLIDPLQDPVWSLTGKHIEFLNIFFLHSLDTWRDIKMDTGTLSTETHSALRLTCYSLVKLCRYCLEELNFDYVLLGKFQTDHLEESAGLLPYVCSVQASEVREFILRDSDSKILAGDLLWQMDEMCFVVLIGIGITIVWMLCLRFWMSIYSWLVMMASAVSTLAFTITLWLAWGNDITLYRRSPGDVMELSKHNERSNLWIVVLVLLTILTIVTLLMIAAVLKKVTMAMCPPYVLLFLWLANIILSCQHFVVASTIAAWYFTRHKTHMSAPVMRSMQLLVGYHLGSVIYGSLALVVADPLRAIISGTRLVWHDNTQAGASATRLVRPCCSCLDRFLMHLNRKAYIVMAMHGLSFRTSGRRVLRLLDRHCQQVAKLDTVSGFVLFLAKFNVALLAVFSGLWIIKENQTTVYVWAPLIAAGCIAYYIADSCISLYEVAVDTLFLCFSEDCEKNNGVTKPYFVTDSLRAFMHDSKNELPDIGSTRVTS
ncbi:hypothetical protein HPB49_017449 [Dermacentor silvarum]|uniref:Uncharacterized protein n=1 Tax=Dermacentor silvarum TaxID=543639 RepID=A0ACB8DQ91_DERSI|nr:hypothetical protein HPB49_017449 [Dermacentor silvarum]